MSTHCPACMKEGFDSEGALRNHQTTTCWVAKSKSKWPLQWTQQLYDFVLRAHQPRYQVEGWSSDSINCALEFLIESNIGLNISWDVELFPQHAYSPPPRGTNQIPAQGGVVASQRNKVFPAAFIPPFQNPPNPNGTSSVLTGINPIPGQGHISGPQINNSYPVAFVPPFPNATPLSLFTHEPGQFYFSRQENEFLIYTFGLAGESNVGAHLGGCAFAFKSPRFPHANSSPAIAMGTYCVDGVFFFRLEDFGYMSRQWARRKRVELRAVVAVLETLCRSETELGEADRNQCRYGLNFRPGAGGEPAKLVIVTDSFYVFEGATASLRSWVENGWMTGPPHRLPFHDDRDLWILLLEKVRALLSSRGCARVSFWHLDQGDYGDQRICSYAKYAQGLPRRRNYGVPNIPYNIAWADDHQSFVEFEI